MPGKKTYSIPALKRLPAYLRELRRLRGEGVARVSSPILARALRIDTISARKDLEMVGVTGSPGVGYSVEQLIDGIETFLGWKNASEAFLVGTGDFGRALLGYPGFAAHGLKIIAAFDRTPPPGEETIHDIPVFELSEFRHLAERLNIRLAILCVPEEEAQQTAEYLVDCGILAIWNFTEHTLHLPEHIIRQRVNLGGDLAVLSVKLAERLDELDNDPDVPTASKGKP